MVVADLLKNKGNQEVFTISKDAQVTECAMEMNQKNVGAIVVVSSSSSVEGMISERDILRAASLHNGSIKNLKVDEIMTHKDKLVIATKDELVEKVMDEMTRNRVRHLPVIENGKLVGIVSIGDIVKDRLNAALIENVSLKNYISGF
jgi:CBS domain-containing protein